MNFFLETLVYIFALVWFMYLPSEGLFVSGNIPYTGWRRLSLGLTVGIALIVSVAYILSFAGFRYLTPVLLSILSIVSVIRWKKWISLLRADWKAPHILLVLFAVVFSLSVVTSGWETGSGLMMRSANGQDGIWNIALAQELAHTDRPQHPSIAGLPLLGYHIFYNLWIAEISRILPVSLIHLHYHFAAMTLSLLFVYAMYALSLRLTQSVSKSKWGTFFAVFGGSFAYVLPYVYHRDLSFDDAFGVTQPYSLLLSPSVTLSLIVIAWTYILAVDIGKKKNILYGFLVALLAGICVGVKIYGGVIVMGALGIYCVYYCLVRKQWIYGLIIVASSLLSALSFFPMNASYGFLIYEFLWPTHQLMRGTLNFTNWDLKRETLLAMGSKRGLLKLEVQAMMMFLLGNMGTRLIGLFGLFHITDISLPLLMLILLSLGISFVIPMLFIQPIGVYNMIQFFWYFLVFAGVVCGIGIARLFEHVSGKLVPIFGIIIVTFTLPSAGWRVYHLLQSYYTPVSRDQMALYKELSSMGTYTDTVVELPRLSAYSAKEFRQWNESMSLPYIPAFGEKRTFVGNEVVQFRYNDLWSDRGELMEKLMSPQNSVLPETINTAYAVMDTLKNTYNVRYIVTSNQTVWFEEDKRAQKLFSNAYGSVYEVN